MRIAVIGHGHVGGALADRLQRAGHEVTVGTDREPSAALAALTRRNPGLRVAGSKEAVAGAEAVILAVPFPAVADVISPLADDLAGRVLIDCTNPVGPGLTHGLRSERAGAELVQELAPGAAVVKAFSVYGAENLDDPAYPDAGEPPMMPVCGDDDAAKAAVAGLARELGWRPLDVGGLAQALHLEHMTLLWVRMVRAGGRSPHTVWAVLER